MKKLYTTLALIFFFSLASSAQIPNPFSTYAGEDLVDGFDYQHNDPLGTYHPEGEGFVVVTTKTVTLVNANGDDAEVFFVPYMIDVDIVAVEEKYDEDQYDNEMTLLVTLSDGTGIFVYIDLADGTTTDANIISPEVNAIGHAMFGDAIYNISSGSIFMSVDSGHTWTIDTLGLHGAYINEGTIDTFQNVYAASNSGLFKQERNSTTWHQLATAPAGACSLIYRDPKARLWTDIGGNLYYSSDTGASWHIDTVGIRYLGIASIRGDHQGNIYVVANTSYFYQSGDRLYKSAGGTAPFVRIDQPLRAMNAVPADSGIFKVVCADSGAIYAGGRRGLFKTTNGGNTWSSVPLRSNSIYGVVGTPTGRVLITNNIGCFYRDAGDSIWHKASAPAGYFGGQPILKDDAGTIYTWASDLGYTAGLSTGPFLVVKSTDNGATWTPDTAGVSQVKMYKWWVDEAGNQYSGGLGTTLANYVKPVGGSWTIDTLGITHGAFDYAEAFGSDHNGRVYHALYTGGLFSRSISGTQWTAESGLNSDPIYTLAHTSTHTMVAGGGSDLHYKTSGASSWQGMPKNAPAPGGSDPFVVAVDDSDYVWAAFSHQGGSGNYVGDGVFYTHDLGQTWHTAVGQVLTATFRLLVPVGDSVFGVTYFDGVFVFKRGNATGIQQVTSSIAYLDVYPNPAGKEMNVRYILSDNSNVTIELTDIAGHKVYSSSQYQSVGDHTTMCDISTLPTGTYICSVTATDSKSKVQTQSTKVSVGK